MKKKCCPNCKVHMAVSAALCKSAKGIPFAICVNTTQVSFSTFLAPWTNKNILMGQNPKPLYCNPKDNHKAIN